MDALLLCRLYCLRSRLVTNSRGTMEKVTSVTHSWCNFVSTGVTTVEVHMATDFEFVSMQVVGWSALYLARPLIAFWSPVLSLVFLQISWKAHRNHHSVTSLCQWHAESVANNSRDIAGAGVSVMPNLFTRHIVSLSFCNTYAIDRNTHGCTSNVISRSYFESTKHVHVMQFYVRIICTPDLCTMLHHSSRCVPLVLLVIIESVTTSEVCNHTCVLQSTHTNKSSITRQILHRCTNIGYTGAGKLLYCCWHVWDYWYESNMPR